MRIVPKAPPPVTVEERLADFEARMSLSQAEKRYGLGHGSLKAACDSGELRHVVAGTRYKVTPSALAEYFDRLQGRS